MCYQKLEPVPPHTDGQFALTMNRQLGALEVGILGFAG